MNTILELAAEKRAGQQLVVAGCLTALHGAELQAEIPEIDAVFGAEDWDGIGAYVQHARAGPARRAALRHPGTKRLPAAADPART